MHGCCLRESDWSHLAVAGGCSGAGEVVRVVVGARCCTVYVLHQRAAHWLALLIWLCQSKNRVTCDCATGYEINMVVDIAAFGHVQGRGDDVSNWLDTHAHDADLGLEALTAILHAASDYQPHQPATAAETEHPPLPAPA